MAALDSMVHPLDPPLVPQILDPRLDPPLVPHPRGVTMPHGPSGKPIHGSQPRRPRQMLPHGGVRQPWPVRTWHPMEGPSEGTRTYANMRHGQMACALCRRCKRRSLVRRCVRRCLVRPPSPLSCHPTRKGARSPGSGSHMDGQHGHPLQPPPMIGWPMGGWHGSRVGGIGMATAVTKPLPGTAWSPPRSNPWR